MTERDTLYKKKYSVYVVSFFTWDTEILCTVDLA